MKNKRREELEVQILKEKLKGIEQKNINININCILKNIELSIKVINLFVVALIGIIILIG